MYELVIEKHFPEILCYVCLLCRVFSEGECAQKTMVLRDMDENILERAVESNTIDMVSN